jgi:uncharacterized protein (TIGR02246 family)
MKNQMDTDEKAIRDLVALWISATKAGDHATVLTLMTDDVIFMVPGREPFGKEAFAVPDRSAAPVIDGTAEVLEVQVHGNWAWARNYLNITFTPPGGEPCALSGYTMGIYRRNAEGKWQLARDANFVAPRGEGVSNLLQWTYGHDKRSRASARYPWLSSARRGRRIVSGCERDAAFSRSAASACALHRPASIRLSRRAVYGAAGLR